MARPHALAFFLCANAALVAADKSKWGGAALSGVHGITEVKGTITMPQIPTNNYNTVQSAAFWVGIDGLSCEYAILQAGVYSSTSDGIKKWDPFIEWFPEKPIYFPDFMVKPGDKIAMSVRADGITSGSATLENLTRKTKVSQTLVYPPYGGPDFCPICGHLVTCDSTVDLADRFTRMETGLCLRDAAWVVEQVTRYPNSGQDGDPYDEELVDFGTVTFTDVTAFTGDRYVGANGPGSTLLNIAGKTDCHITGTDADTVSCVHVP